MRRERILDCQASENGNPAKHGRELFLVARRCLHSAANHSDVSNTHAWLTIIHPRGAASALHIGELCGYFSISYGENVNPPHVPWLTVAHLAIDP